MNKTATPQGPLKDIRVIDLGHLLAGPFAATLLADFGADVIKVEPVDRGDPMRELGPKAGQESVWWKSLARNKNSVGLNWGVPEGREVLLRLVAKANVLIENFRPGVLERKGLSEETLFEINPDLVIVRISGYGQHGPYRARPGFGKAAEAMSGVLHLSGFPEGPPTHQGFPMGDMTTGLMGAYGVMLALFAIERGICRGQVIDLPIYETPMRLLDYHVPVRTGTDVVPTRNGNRQPIGVGLSGVFQSQDGRWLTYSAATFTTARRILELIGGDSLRDDPRFVDLASVSRHDVEINQKLSAWMSARTAKEIISEFEQAHAVTALVYDTDDILSDPHIAARENIASVDGETVKVVNVVPKLSVTPGSVSWLGRRQIGADTQKILRDILHFDEASMHRLAQEGVIREPGHTRDSGRHTNQEL
jgi:crotonobetainyl-CoA:carnitine CoA-transferase CaiB-like acyl-CoA transferase